MNATYGIASCGLFACLLLCSCSGRTDGDSGPGPSDKPIAGDSAAPKPQTTSATSKQALDLAADKQFAEIRTRLLNAAGPGGVKAAVPIQRDLPITFSAIPASKLLADVAPGGVGDNIDQLTTNKYDKQVYPIRRGNQIVSSFTLGLRAAPGGAPEVHVLEDGRDDRFAKVIEFAQKQQMANEAADAPPQSYKGVYVPALNQQFLYYKDGNVTKMIPLTPNPGLGFEVGKALPAGEVLAKLRKSMKMQAAREKAPG